MLFAFVQVNWQSLQISIAYLQVVGKMAEV